MLATGGSGIRMAWLPGPGVEFPSPRRGLRDPANARLGSEGPPPLLLALDRLEQRLEVPLAEAAGPVALDHFEEEGGAVLDRLGEDLEQVPLLVAVDEDPQLGEVAQVLGDRADAAGEQLVVGLGDAEEADVVVAHGADR